LRATTARRAEQGSARRVYIPTSQIFAPIFILPP
jgi:hypothetical protein